MSPSQAVQPRLAMAQGTSQPRDFWVLMKPKVMRLVVFSAVTGMVLAPVQVHPVLAIVALLCICAAAGASAAINNWYDADIDRVMVRTRLRPTASGRIEPAEALAFGVTVGLFSVMLMGLALNWLAAGLLAATILFYVFVYTLWLKRRTPQNIVIGGAAGALPPVVGWAAMTGEVGLLPLLIFAIIFIWTPPHFWALALYRSKDYASVGVPMLPVVAGDLATRRQIIAYTAVLMPLTLSPWLLGLAGPVYGVLALGLGLWYGHANWLVWTQPSDRVSMRAFKISIAFLFGVLAAFLADHGLMALASGWGL